ncbi:MAG: hypothetical protein C6Y22_21350 [Hapalosiphonaceae cyanobacterium JJU2]|nr:MAG: hypothetical protein C6Y22_21350 [Hapalosiphonaceae cyanobacterium JJU2]
MKIDKKQVKVFLIVVFSKVGDLAAQQKYPDPLSPIPRLNLKRCQVNGRSLNQTVRIEKANSNMSFAFISPLFNFPE